VEESGWGAVRPSGIENIYMIYAEFFHGADHVSHIQKEVQAIVNNVMAAKY
jgi:phosphoglucomutase